MELQSFTRIAGSAGVCHKPIYAWEGTFIHHFQLVLYTNNATMSRQNEIYREKEEPGGREKREARSRESGGQKAVVCKCLFLELENRCKSLFFDQQNRRKSLFYVRKSAISPYL